MGAFPIRTAQVLRLLIAMLLALSSAPAVADEPRALPAPIGAGGRAYLETAQGSGASVEVTYFDPGRPAPELRTDVAVEPPPGPPPSGTPDDRQRIELGPWTVGAVFAAILASVLLLATRFGGVRAVSFARPPGRGDRRARRAPAGRAVPVDDPGPDSLDAIAGMADRGRALHVLLERALERAAAANGQRIGRSQTVRDVLRALPAAWPLLPALRAVAAQAEVVQFGGRALSEEAFHACLEAARPLFADAAARPAGGR